MRLVRCNTDYFGFVGGACEARSRQEEEVDVWPSSTTTNGVDATKLERSSATPIGKSVIICVTTY